MKKSLMNFDLKMQVGPADYYDSQSVTAHSLLMMLAPEVLLLARCEGAPKTAKYFSERLNLEITEKMIKGIKAKAKNGALVVTREELEKVAQSHPITAARMLREPTLCDPRYYGSSISIVVENPKPPTSSKQNPVKKKQTNQPMQGSPTLLREPHPIKQTTGNTSVHLGKVDPAEMEKKWEALERMKNKLLHEEETNH